MLGKKFALGFGIAIILPMLLYYGVSTFSPAPKIYRNGLMTTEYQDAKKWQERQNIFQRNLFSVAFPIGIASIILGAMTPVQAIGTGFMFGGIFTLIEGYTCSWSELEDSMRFLSLLAVFIVLIFIGYKKLTK